MTLEGIVGNAVNATRRQFLGKKQQITDYLRNGPLRSYFEETIPSEEREKLDKTLERKVNLAIQKYDEELGGLGRKLTSKGSMALAVANDISAYVSSIPIANVTGLGYALFAIKTLTEIPAMIRYVKKSKDWYGAIGNTLLKPVRYLIPVIGPALESGAFDRMVKRRVTKEAKDAFLKEVGEYVPFDERMKFTLTQPVGQATYKLPVRPIRKAA